MDDTPSGLQQAPTGIIIEMGPYTHGIDWSELIRIIYQNGGHTRCDAKAQEQGNVVSNTELYTAAVFCCNLFDPWGIHPVQSALGIQFSCPEQTVEFQVQPTIIPGPEHHSDLSTCDLS